MLTPQDARTLVGLQAGDDSRDTRLQQLIDAAYEQAALHVGPLTQSTVTETVTVQNGIFLLRALPVTGLTSVTNVADVGTLNPVARTGLVRGMPETSSSTSVTVTYSQGYATVPASVEEGVRAWVKHRWLQESYGTDTYGDQAVSDAVTDFDGLPNAVRNAWEPFLISRMGFA